MKRALCIAGCMALVLNCGLLIGFTHMIDEELLRGDANNDAQVDMSDSIFIQSYLFSGGAAPSCMSAADVNDDGRVDQSDSIYLMNFLFMGGPKPPAPYPYCDEDYTADNLTCRDSACQ